MPNAITPRKTVSLLNTRPDGRRSFRTTIMTYRMTLANMNRKAAASNGGTVASPTLMANHVDPQIMQITTSQNMTFVL